MFYDIPEPSIHYSLSQALWIRKLIRLVPADRTRPYHKFFLHYSIGVGKIYNPEGIEKERQQFYFKREYELNYSVAIGNIFTGPDKYNLQMSLSKQANDNPT